MFFGAALGLFREAGIPVPMVSGGGTPALATVERFPMLTEHRAGTCVFNDAMVVSTGTAGWDDCAMRVRATVVSRPTPERAVLDAGSKVLTSDQYFMKGFGHVMEYPAAAVIHLSEEHAVVDLTACPERPKVGDVVQVVPNHCCVVSNMVDELHGVRGDDGGSGLAGRRARPRALGGRMPRTGAMLLVDALVEAGVRPLFSLSGNQILSVYDATIGRPLPIVHTRHEAGAVHMADAWGRLTEKPGVALVTAGPGHLNAVSALYGALMSESPMVLLSGHAPRGQAGRGAFQEMDQVGAARPVTKAAWRVEDAAHMGVEVTRALAIAAAGRPGPRASEPARRSPRGDRRRRPGLGPLHRRGGCVCRRRRHPRPDPRSPRGRAAPAHRARPRHGRGRPGPPRWPRSRA